MLKKALEFLMDLKEPIISEINCDTYSDKPLHRIDPYYPKAATLTLSTLSGLIDYIKSNVDVTDKKMIIEVAKSDLVRLYSPLDGNRDREYLVDVKALLPDFAFGRFIEHETFCINLQAKFIPNEDRDLLLKFAGTVSSGTVADYGDDGVTQKATIKTGVTSKSDAIVPNPVKLRPYRTFLEVEQPESQFIFRMKDDKGVECAIFEADGGAWKTEAKQNIKAYLKEQLEDMPQFIIIA